MPRPRQRQRTVVCDCFDCRDDLFGDRSEPRPEDLTAASRAARQDPPPKAIVIHGCGFLRQLEGELNAEQTRLPHLDLVVREGNLGLLAARPHSTGTGSEHWETRYSGISELAQVLGCHQELADAGGLTALLKTRLPSLQSRFKNMQALFASTSQPATQLAELSGCTLSRILLPAQPAAASSPITSSTASEVESSTLVLPAVETLSQCLLADMGLSDGSSGPDLLYLHLDLADLLPPASAAHFSATGLPILSPHLMPDQHDGCDSTPSQLNQPSNMDAESSRSAPSETHTAQGLSGMHPLPNAAIHRASPATAEELWEASCVALEWLDSLVKHLLGDQGVRGSCLLVLLLTPGGEAINGAPSADGWLQPAGPTLLHPSAVVITPRSAAAAATASILAQSYSRASPGCSITTTTTTMHPSLANEAITDPISEVVNLRDRGRGDAVPRPVQSFELLGQSRVQTDPWAPMLVARRLPGVIRRDRAESMSIAECTRRGGVGAMLVDRLLPEIAYKLGRAPKYGA